MPPTMRVIQKDAVLEAPPAAVVRYNPLLPYWAVFQADLRQTLRSWVYRCWVLVWVVAAVGYLLYCFGVHHEAGIVQQASAVISDLLRWTVLGSVTLIVVLTGGSISSERGTLADSVLSKGISRHQYFLGKWHARLVVVLSTFAVLGAILMVGCYFLLHDDLDLAGGLVALVIVVAWLSLIISCGVTVSALSNNTLVGIAVLWMVLYGAGFTLSLLQHSLPSPEQELQKLTSVLQGHYKIANVRHLLLWSTLGSCAMAAIGMFGFSRRDV